MLLKPDCIPCVLKMTLSLLRQLPIGEEKLEEIYHQALTLPAIRGKDWKITPPQVVEDIMGFIQDAVSESDPFSAIKQGQNDQVAAIYPDLKECIRDASDPLETAVKIAIIGNAIDFMLAGRPSDIRSFIYEKLDTSIAEECLSDFRQRLFEARSLVYFTDNCGEVILDRLFIETLHTLSPGKAVTFVVRNTPTLNDVTIKEAHAVGLDTVGAIIDNGIDGPLPGTIPSRCSQQVKELIAKADLIISKGGGNFNALGESIFDLNTDVSFLLLSKCIPFSQQFDVRMFDLVLYNAFRNCKNTTDLPP